MKIAINIEQVYADIQGKLALLQDKELLLRPICFDLIDLMTKRIHLDGLDSNGKPIGDYSAEYMKVRTGIGFLSDTISRGVNKGKPRPKYNRTNDTKVICSLTRQLENDWNVIETERGYGVGFLNEINFNKVGWLEDTYGVKIFATTESELDHAIDLLNTSVNNIFDES